MTFYDLLHNQRMNKQIKEFVRTRCEDYKDNQSKMIDSIIERTKRTIVIDRVLKEKDGQQLLITDPEEIKHITNEHFQTCPGGIHTRQELPIRWQQQYS